MVSKTNSPAALSMSQLRSDFKDRVIAPGDAEYDKARTVFYGGIDRKPAVMIRPVNAEEAARVIALARETGLELAVRSGGHSMTGKSVCEGGIVLDLSNMKGLQIDAKARTAWAEAGLTAGEFTEAANAHGLGVGFGDTGSVGIGGITLGGGIGYLVRKYGMTIDSLLAAEIVTAEGQLLRVDEQNHPDLFWAIRGGGGNFGVVTRFQFRLHEVDQVVGGMLILPATAANIASFIAEAESAPEELSTIMNVMMAPPMPFLPPEAHGKLIIMALMIYAGDVTEGQRVVDRFRAIDTPISDMLRPMRYPEMFQEEEEGEYHPVAAARTFFIDQVDRSVAETILRWVQSSNGAMAVAHLRVLGGAMARVPAEATAFAHRNARILTNVAALYQNPDEKAKHEAWVEEFAAALQQSDQGAYVNFLGDEGEERLHAAYPGSTWDRLVEVKARYDPDNLFHLNQNIQPAAA